MVDRGVLESAILDAEGSRALLFVAEDAFLSATDAGPNRLGITAPDGTYVFALDYAEYYALLRAIDMLGADVKAISKAFYAAIKVGAV